MPTTIAITGANRGIGLAVATELAAHGHRVLMVCRNVSAAEDARAAMPSEAAARATVVPGDLGTLDGTRAAAEAVASAAGAGLDVLIHNAGLWPVRRKLNPDGFEEAFAVNHLAPFLLTSLLAPALADRRGRVVQVTAGLYPIGRFDPDRTPTGADFGRIKTYAHTKQANLLAMRAWAPRLERIGVTINAVHPGVVRTGLGRSRGPLGWLVGFAKLFWMKPRDGAAGPVRLATDPELSDVTGAFFDQLQRADYHPVAEDSARNEAVWQQAARLTGVTPEREAPPWQQDSNVAERPSSAS